MEFVDDAGFEGEGGVGADGEVAIEDVGEVGIDAEVGLAGDATFEDDAVVVGVAAVGVVVDGGEGDFLGGGARRSSRNPPNPMTGRLRDRIAHVIMIRMLFIGYLRQIHQAARFF